MKVRKVVYEIIVCCFIVLWVYTGVNKLYDYSQFKIQLGKSPFISTFSSFIAIVLPLAELILATLLVSKKMRIIGMYFSLFLMAIFSVYIYAMLHFSYNIPCSCGGVLESLSWQAHLYFNLGLVALAVIGILLSVEGRNNTPVASGA